MKVALGSDHAGFELKEFLLKGLTNCGFEIIDCGAENLTSVDYPDYARKVCGLILNGDAELGILICGTGIGISIAANKIKGIRAALCHTEFSARMSRLHNNANVLVLGGRIVGTDLALEIAKTFLTSDFSNESRHQKRIDKITDIENSNGIL